MTNIAVPVPPSLAHMREPLRLFFQGMIRKLDLNSHKDTPTVQDVPTMLTLLRRELEEFEEQMTIDPRDPNALVELYDGANFAFLIAMALRADGTPTLLEQFLNEHYTIDPATGRIFCRKGRAGSRYKPGHEIHGTKRNGYVDIKIQRYRSAGGGQAVQRSHLVWWKATGRWPHGVIDHINHLRDDDRIVNLRDVSFSENVLNNNKVNKLPSFVTQYRPTGRQHLAHYGKYVYQRTHHGLVVRCAYYDTPELAATLGAADWLARINELEKQGSEHVRTGTEDAIVRPEVGHTAPD